MKRYITALAEDVVSGDLGSPDRLANVGLLARRHIHDRRYIRAYFRAWQRRVARGGVGDAADAPPAIIRGGYAKLPATPPLPFAHRRRRR